MVFFPVMLLAENIPEVLQRPASIVFQLSDRWKEKRTCRTSASPCGRFAMCHVVERQTGDRELPVSCGCCGCRGFWCTISEPPENDRSMWEALLFRATDDRIARLSRSETFHVPKTDGWLPMLAVCPFFVEGSALHIVLIFDRRNPVIELDLVREIPKRQTYLHSLGIETINGTFFGERKAKSANSSGLIRSSNVWFIKVISSARSAGEYLRIS